MLNVCQPAPKAIGLLRFDSNNVASFKILLKLRFSDDTKRGLDAADLRCIVVEQSKMLATVGVKPEIYRC